MKHIFLSLLGVILVSAAAFAQSDGGGRLAGTWDTRVSILNCQTGDVIRSFDSVGTFMAGGTMIDSTSGIPQALKTPGQGIWRHVEGNTYRFKFKAFGFDPAGNYTGYTIISHEATLNKAGDVFESFGTAKIYDPNGNVVMVGCSSTVQTRFELD